MNSALGYGYVVKRWVIVRSHYLRATDGYVRRISRQQENYHRSIRIVKLYVFIDNSDTIAKID